MRVLKFGGSSLANYERIKNVIQIIKKARLERQAVAVVVSAFKGVTDALIQVSATAAKTNTDYGEILRDIENQHLAILQNAIPTAQQGQALLKLKLCFNELEELLHGIELIGERSPRSLDKVMSFGERLSAFLLTEALNYFGEDVEFLDSRKIIKTDENYGCGYVISKSFELIKEYFKTHQKLQIVTGFIAASPDGNTVTLGRGGSDYSAALIGAALDCEEIEIWTDVDGVMTADPNKVRKAFSIPFLSYEEAMELSNCGAKVIYPPTMQPAMSKNIPIRILNSFNPTYDGTIIEKTCSKKIDQTLAYQANHNSITGISSLSEVALIRLEGSGMVGVSGVSQRLFGALAAQKISAIMISQASSEHSICFAVQTTYANLAKKALEQEFSREIESGTLSDVILEDKFSIVSIVGEQMKRLPGLAGRMCQALGKNGVNISAIAQGSSELNISTVITAEDEIKALNALHDEFFFPDKKVINVFLIGTGLIGSELLKQIAAQQEYLNTTLAHEIRVMAVANSRKMLFATSEQFLGLEVATISSQLEMSQLSSDIPTFIKKVKELNLPNSVIVDCTASNEIPKYYEDILHSSISIVTPNKKSQTSTLSSYLALKKAAMKRGVSFLYETSVGAGLPILNTLNDLLKSGDRIIKIEAVLSGTLSYIFNSFKAGTNFSDVVLQAKKAGYTEPDPRDDLNGLDVARKILILARDSGFNLELSDIEVENLVPQACQETSELVEFFKRLKEHDVYFERIRSQAEACQKKIVYIASLHAGKASVKLESVDVTHPFYNLSGSDNIVSFTTNRYNTCPLVVKGPGAGAAVTAAGVFADIIRIAS